MKTVTYNGERFLLENISSFRFEESSPAMVNMNVFSMPEPPKQAYLIITYTNGNSRTITGPEATDLHVLLLGACAKKQD